MIVDDDSLAKRMLYRVRMRAWNKGLSTVPVRQLSSPTRDKGNGLSVSDGAPWDLMTRRHYTDDRDDNPGLAWDLSTKYRHSPINSAQSTTAILKKERGWGPQLTAAHLLNSWTQIVGPSVAEHCTVMSSIHDIVTDHTLVLRASSSSWAQQIRLMMPSIQAHIDDVVGSGVITKVIVQGPAQRSWTHGKRSVRGGRGPRDTYG